MYSIHCYYPNTCLTFQTFVGTVSSVSDDRQTSRVMAGSKKKQPTILGFLSPQVGESKFLPLLIMNICISV